MWWAFLTLSRSNPPTQQQGEAWRQLWRSTSSLFLNRINRWKTVCNHWTGMDSMVLCFTPIMIWLCQAPMDQHASRRVWFLTMLQDIERGICEEPEYQEDTKLLQLACQISSKEFDCYFQVSCTLEDEPFVWHDLRNAQFTLCSVKEQAQTKPENLWWFG